MNFLIGYLAVINVIAYIYMYVVYRIKVLDVPEKTNKVIISIFCFLLGFIGVFLCREMFNIEDEKKYYKKVVIPIVVVELVVLFIAGNGNLRKSLGNINFKGLLTNEISINETLEELNMLPENITNATNEVNETNDTNVVENTSNEIESNEITNETLENVPSENTTTNETNEVNNTVTNDTFEGVNLIDYNDILGSAQALIESYSN